MQLKYADMLINKRKQLFLHCSDYLKDIQGLSFWQPLEDTEWNYAFSPVLFDEKIYGH